MNDPRRLPDPALALLRDSRVDPCVDFRDKDDRLEEPDRFVAASVSGRGLRKWLLG